MDSNYEGSSGTVKVRRCGGICEMVFLKLYCLKLFRVFLMLNDVVVGIFVVVLSHFLFKNDLMMVSCVIMFL